MAANNIPAPPAGLAARGKSLWRATQSDYELDPLESELLTELCRVVDRCDVLERELKGLKSLATLGSTGQWRCHPLMGALEGQQKLADRLCSSLGISMPTSSGAGKRRGHQSKAIATRWSRAAKGAPASVTRIAGA